MSKWISIYIYTTSGAIAAISQLLLKTAAVKFGGKSRIKKILNWRIILAYSMLILTLFMNMIALRFIPYKFATVLSTLSYIFVLLLSRFALKEIIDKKQAIGIILIFCGIAIFYAS